MNVARRVRAFSCRLASHVLPKRASGVAARDQSLAAVEVSAPLPAEAEAAGGRTSGLEGRSGGQRSALASGMPRGPKATRTNKSFIGVLWGAWSDGVVAHWVELIALEVEAAISSFTDLGPPQTRFTRSCVCPNLTESRSRAPGGRARA